MLVLAVLFVGGRRCPPVYNFMMVMFAAAMVVSEHACAAATVFSEHACAAVKKHRIQSAFRLSWGASHQQ